MLQTGKATPVVLAVAVSLCLGGVSGGRPVVMAGGASQAAAPTRPAAVAGSFYPADSRKLRAAIDGYLRDAVPARPARPLVLIVPHAGLVFSGQIAADAFRQTAGHPVETVVILGANHTTAGFDRAAVYDGPDWETPLGRVVVDRTVAQAVVDARVGAVFDSGPHAREHSIEVHVPFVQALHPGAAIVPIVIGAPDPALCLRLGRELARLAAQRPILIVASSDLSHYPAAADARRLDREVLEALMSDSAASRLVSAEMAVRTPESVPVAGLVTRACGLGPLLVAREAARALGARAAVVLSYANSADTVPGTPDRVVGYAAVSFSEGPPGADTDAVSRPRVDAESALDREDKRHLLRLARETIARGLASDTLPLPRGGSPRLLRETGAFVTLRARGEMRGCIGRVAAEGPLNRLVSAMALQSAIADPRFGPVRPGELAGIEIEVSVLTRPRDVGHVDEIVPGRDGVVFRLGDKGAVFLPQVAAEEGWSRADLLQNLALKAGLPPSGWRDRKARFQTFQADVFSETSVR
ncbi:MAG: AmmeMemoRadiSam system protein B [Vicinamibacterales bacterium]|nr:AmmeMemoRadiSam system protein B [Vicinamibacterales bacterium]